MEFTISKKDFNKMVSLAGTMHDDCSKHEEGGREIPCFKVTVNDDKLEAVAIGHYGASKFVCFVESEKDFVAYLPMMKKVTAKCNDVTIIVDNFSAIVLNGTDVIDSYHWEEDFSNRFPERAIEINVDKSSYCKEFSICVNPIMLSKILAEFNEKEYDHIHPVRIDFCGKHNAFFITGDGKRAMVMPVAYRDPESEELF